MHWRPGLAQRMGPHYESKVMIADSERDIEVNGKMNPNLKFHLCRRLIADVILLIFDDLLYI